MESRTREGTLISPSPGSSITMMPMRANTSMKVAASAGRNEMSIRMRASPRRDPRRQPDHVGLQMVGHERQCDQHGNENRRDLGHEGERHFLDLSERLEQRDDHADNEPNEQQRA